MVAAFPLRRGAGAFALSELLIASTIFSAISLGLLMGFTALERNYAATIDFGTNHGDQMRISDYMALDLRRAVAVTAATNDTSIFIPAYYDGNNNPVTPTLDGTGGVNYGDPGVTVRIHYYLAGNSIYRQQGSGKSIALADDVQDFVFNVTDSGKVVKTRITFSPTFTSGKANAAVTAATAFYNTTLLRNNRTDIKSGVY